MIQDLDYEMTRRGIKGIVGLGETTLADPDLTYVVGGVLARGGFYFKNVGRPPLLVVSTLDYGSARKHGRVKRIETLTDWGYEAFLRKYADRSSATAHLVASVLRSEKVRGKVVLFGRNDLAKGLDLAHAIRRLGVQIVGERPPTVLEACRDTKSTEEIQRIRDVANRTARVVDAVLEMLRNSRSKRGHLEVHRKRATVGLIKSVIASRLADQALIAPEGTIFAVGSSSADPHNIGIPSAEIKPGKLIVFDIFPQSESGYWFDMTRTFVVGRASPKAKKIYETVLDAQSNALNYLRAGATGDTAMNRVCDLIERAGFNTVRRLYEGKARRISSGLTHAIGHGVGLTIGEAPYLGYRSKTALKAGEVVTVEPGIYLPGYGGVRIEDTVLIKSKGIENLAHVKKELELT
jgi:Xaa-Pro aminopeptidase